MLWKRKQWNDTLEKGYPHIVIDNFLDEETALKLYDECIDGAPRGGWTNFTRAGSNMEEYNDLVYCEKGHKITYDLMHSGEMCYELEQLTDMVGLMPDPHLVGMVIQMRRRMQRLQQRLHLCLIGWLSLVI
jgi:hypothetical protein